MTGYRASRSVLALVFMSALAAMTSAMTERVQPVSPGGARAFPIVEGRCPTFSWTAVDGARGYELVAYAVSETATPLAGSLATSAAVVDAADPAIRVRLPGKASSWTPSGEQCLARGESYAWAVRAVDARTELEWSEARLFKVRSAPSEEDVREALETLERYLEDGGSTAVVPFMMTASATAELAPPAALLPGPIPTMTSWAISAELEDAVSASAGIEARSNSASGIAVIGQNTAGGQIASFQSGTNEVATIAGDGTVEAKAFVGDGSGLTNLPGGGGGSSVIADFTSRTTPLEGGGTIATLSITAPTGGCTLVATGTVDLELPVVQGNVDKPNCEIQVDSTALPGSNMEVYTDLNVFTAECVSSGGIALAAGPHTIDFVVNVDAFGGDDPAVPNSATLWAICVP